MEEDGLIALIRKSPVQSVSLREKPKATQGAQGQGTSCRKPVGNKTKERTIARKNPVLATNGGINGPHKGSKES